MPSTVWVYRSLRFGRKSPPLYSVMVKGRVVRRVSSILLRDARFVVREGGRQRALKEGRKNVHAFVVGTPAYAIMGIDRYDKKGLPAKIRYRPQDGPDFYWDGRPVKTARAVLLNADGISAAYTEDH